MIYARKIKSDHAMFKNREIKVMSAESMSRIPVPDGLVLCNGCNQHQEESYLVFLSKTELKSNRPYDTYCKECLKRYFPKAEIV